MFFFLPSAPVLRLVVSATAVPPLLFLLLLLLLSLALLCLRHDRWLVAGQGRA